jgi:hypothetical protein
VHARVTLHHRDTGATRSTLTGANGRYRLASVEPGDYDIAVEAPGFNRIRQRLTLRVGDNPTIDFELTAGFATDVDIEGHASGIDTTGFKVDGVVSRTQIENLPLNGRSFLELARLQPGVQVDAVVNAGAFGNNYQRVSIGGASYLQTRITVDGSMVEDRINGGTAQNWSQESVQEFQISTFSFDPGTATTGTGAREHRHAKGQQRLPWLALLLLSRPSPRRLPGAQARRAATRSLLRAQAVRVEPGRPAEEGPSLLVRQRRAPGPGRRLRRRQQPPDLLEAGRGQSEPASTSTW